MEYIRSRDFVSDAPWGARLIATMQGVTTKIHWTNKPYKWHTNDGEEVFVVLDGEVNMLYREKGEEHCQLLQIGDVFFAQVCCEYVAYPKGEARVLVVEKEGSI